MTRHIVTTWSRAGRFTVCDDLAISDHLAISFSVPVPLPSQPSKQTITFRKTKQCCFSSFTTLDSDQVLDLVSKAKTSSSKLDPMPTTLVKTCLPVT
ncbi:unnamed protein product [Arctogadus glacialis]